MTVGVRLRDADTGQVVLDFSDFTVRTVYSRVLTISSDGSVFVPDIDSSNAGGFLIPAHQSGYPYQSGGWLGDYRSSQPKIYIHTNTVSWALGSGQPAALWFLLVVKYR